MIFVLLCSVIATAQVVDYYELYLKTAYKEVAVNPKTLESWGNGLKKSYDFNLDHINIDYKKLRIESTTDGRVAVIGTTRLIAFTKDTSEVKKRVVSIRTVVHLFKDKELDDSVLLEEKPYVVLVGWDDGMEI